MFPIYQHLHPASIVPHTKYDSISGQSSEQSLLENYESDLINPNFHKSNKEEFSKVEDKIKVLSLLVKFKYARHCGEREKQNEILKELQKVFENKPGFYACLALVKNSSCFFKVALPQTFKDCILEVVNNKNTFDFIRLKKKLTKEEFNFIKKIAPSQFKATELLAEKALENEDKKYLYKGLLKGLNANDKKRIEEIFFEDADVNQIDENEKTFLWTSIENGQNKAVKLLLTRFNIDVNKSDNEGKTPLFIAIETKNEPAIKLLLSHYAIDVNKPDNQGRTPLQIALKAGYTEAVQLLLKHDDMDADKEIEENYLLHLAVKEGYIKIVQLLISRPNTNVIKADRSGNTPLQIAEKNKHSEIIDLLNNRIADYIKEGLDQATQNQLANILPSILGVDGNTPLIAPYIYSRDLDLYHVYDFIYSIQRNLIEVILKRHEIGLLKLAFQYGKIKLQEKICGWQRGNVIVVRTFIDFFLSNWANEFGKEILHLILTDSKININERGRSGFSILYDLLVNKTLLVNVFVKEFVEPILNHPKIDVNMQDRQGNTLLHILAASGDHCKTDALEILLDHPQIDAARQNQDGETPFSIAVKNNCQRNASLILQKLSEDQLRADRKLETKMLFEMHLNKSFFKTQGINDDDIENYHINDHDDIFDIMDGYWDGDKPVYELEDDRTPDLLV